MTPDTPAHLTDWHGHHWTPDADQPTAHPNARFTVAAAQCTSLAPEWEASVGVPIDAFLFGGRRATVAPLVREAFDWQHGVFLAATMSSEKTPVAGGSVGELRFDRFAMLPFCGYNIGDYFAHWLTIRQRTTAKLPRICCVNWFRKNATGEFFWPGNDDNSRVLAWIFPPLRQRRRSRPDTDRARPRRRGSRPHRPHPRPTRARRTPRRRPRRRPCRAAPSQGVPHTIRRATPPGAASAPLARGSSTQRRVTRHRQPASGQHAASHSLQPAPER